MIETNYYLKAFVLISLQSIVISEISLGSCDYQKYPINGCVDELGSDCDTTVNECRCKPNYWLIVDKQFCFPKECPKGEYYDHNYGRCEPQRRASLISEENYCRYAFHCRGNHIHCERLNEWNYQCVCKQGFVYDTTTQECQNIVGINGFCVKDDDCDDTRVRNLICGNNTCQCAQGFTYNINIEGCEDNKAIEERDSQTRKMMFLFIGLGLFFGAALSLKFGSSAPATQQIIFKRVVEQSRQQREQQRLQRLQEQEQQLQEVIVIDLDTNDKKDKTETLINNRETA